MRTHTQRSVSYTHLDVYKRQVQRFVHCVHLGYVSVNMIIIWELGQYFNFRLVLACRSVSFENTKSYEIKEHNFNTKQYTLIKIFILYGITL